MEHSRLQSPSFLVHGVSFLFENGEKNLRFKDIRIRVDEVSKLLLFSVPNLSKNSLYSSSLRSPTEASPLFIVGRARDKEKESARGTMGREREACSRLFPLPIFPPRAFCFSTLLWYPAGASTEERAVTQQIPTDEKIVSFFLLAWITHTLTARNIRNNNGRISVAYIYFWFVLYYMW